MRLDLDNKTAANANSKKTITEACRGKKIFRFSPTSFEETKNIPAGWYAFITILEEGKPITYARGLINFESNHDGIVLFLKRIGIAEQNQMLSELSFKSIAAAGEIIFGVGGEIIGWCFATGHHDTLDLSDDSPRLKNRKLAVSLPDFSFCKVQDWISLLGASGVLRTYFDPSGKYRALNTPVSEESKLAKAHLSKLRLLNRILRAHKMALANSAANALLPVVPGTVSVVNPTAASTESIEEDKIDHVAFSASVRGLFPGAASAPRVATAKVAVPATPPAPARRLINVAPAPQPPVQLPPLQPGSPVIAPIAAVAAVVTGNGASENGTAATGAGVEAAGAIASAAIDEKRPATRQNKLRGSVNRSGFFGPTAMTRGDGDAKVGGPLESVDERTDPTNLAPGWCCCSCYKVN